MAEVTRALQPCPFCGGPPKPIATRGASPYGVFPDSELQAPEGLWVRAYVFCHECGAQGETVTGWCYSREDVDTRLAEACDLWNTRDRRHGYLYNASAAAGLNVWPRARDRTC